MHHSSLRFMFCNWVSQLSLYLSLLLVRSEKRKTKSLNGQQNYNRIRVWCHKAMAAKKIIAICQSGGEFVTNIDGSLSYNGGDAYAIDIDHQTLLSDFKSEVAELFNCSADIMSIKYFLPGNRRTLITISKDKDLQRMVNFLGDSSTVDVFLLLKDVAACNVSNISASRSSRTTVSEAVIPCEAPIDVAVDMTHTVGGFDMDFPNGDPISCIPIRVIDDKQHKAAQQWENTITGVDQRFNSFTEFREALHKYSIAHGFAYRYKKNDSHRVSVKCKTQGAAVKAGYRATRGWVGSIIKEKLKVSPNYKPKDIAEDIKREYGIQLNYSQAWRAKEIAREQLQGSYKEAYNQLPFFCEKIKETNPGSIATFSTKDDSSFHRLFVSFHASISGFDQGCRPLIFLDSIPLNSKYQGTLLAATAADADDGIFPLAFAVVDAETEDNWLWFLLELKSAVSASRQITFVADFQNGLKKSLAEIFDKCYHSYCLRHLAEKLNKDLKGQFSHEARRFMVNDLYAAAYAPRLEGFQRSVENIKGISPEAYNWVLQSEPEHWANAFFGGARYDHMTSNFGQQFYDWISEAHELPITQMVDALRGKMMEAIYTRRVESNQWTTKLTPSKEEKLEKEMTTARSLKVLLSHGSTFEVRGESVDVVDIDHWDCSCKGWQLTGLPCCHAVAVFECIGRGPYDYCSRYFTTESYRISYAESIQPVPNVDRPVQGELTEAGVIVTPPPTKRPPGRPKMKQAESTDIIKRQLQCSKCKGLGHNKKTCKES
ncbi:POLYPROTEIN putative-RELATED [Salix purpurea]|uniref:POLYPROTEIN putative-RELATED n=1 Tax=Salix purpurea TaxID=77065 RepID=A0A9Q0Z8S1_SALPP|nr:POLYPROTEIN putative-RELATED [Salix purpurea]